MQRSTTRIETVTIVTLLVEYFLKNKVNACGFIGFPNIYLINSVYIPY